MLSLSTNRRTPKYIVPIKLKFINKHHHIAFRGFTTFNRHGSSHIGPRGNTSHTATEKKKESPNLHGWFKVDTLSRALAHTRARAEKKKTRAAM